MPLSSEGTHTLLFPNPLVSQALCEEEASSPPRTSKSGRAIGSGSSGGSGHSGGGSGGGSGGAGGSGGSGWGGPEVAIRLRAQRLARLAAGTASYNGVQVRISLNMDPTLARFGELQKLLQGAGVSLQQLTRMAMVFLNRLKEEGSAALCGAPELGQKAALISGSLATHDGGRSALQFLKLQKAALAAFHLTLGRDSPEPAKVDNASGLNAFGARYASAPAMADSAAHLGGVGGAGPGDGSAPAAAASSEQHLPQQLVFTAGLRGQGVLKELNWCSAVTVGSLAAAAPPEQPALPGGNVERVHQAVEWEGAVDWEAEAELREQARPHPDLVGGPGAAAGGTAAEGDEPLRMCEELWGCIPQLRVLVAVGDQPIIPRDQDVDSADTLPPPPTQQQQPQLQPQWHAKAAAATLAAAVALGLLSIVAQLRMNAGSAPHKEPVARPKELSGKEWEGARPVVLGGGGLIVWVPALLGSVLLRLLDPTYDTATLGSMGMTRGVDLNKGSSARGAAAAPSARPQIGRR